MQVRPGSKVLDVGCGVGGPMRNIAVFGDCQVQGITINQYQVSLATGCDVQNAATTTPIPGSGAGVVVFLVRRYRRAR